MDETIQDGYDEGEGLLVDVVNQDTYHTYVTFGSFMYDNYQQVGVDDFAAGKVLKMVKNENSGQITYSDRVSFGNLVE